MHRRRGTWQKHDSYVSEDDSEMKLCVCGFVFCIIIGICIRILTLLSLYKLYKIAWQILKLSNYQLVCLYFVRVSVYDNEMLVVSGQVAKAFKNGSVAAD